MANMSVLEFIFIRASLAAILIQITMATNHTVGGPNGGWDTSSNLQAWASSQKFSVGDNLIFQYPPNHNVIEVSKPDYDSCQPTKPIQSYNDGTTTIPLASPGKRYFICGSLGHCSQGMKLEIDTLASATSSTSPELSPSPAASPVIPVIPSIESPESNSPAESPEFTNSPAESADFTDSPAESPEDIPTTPSPLFETHPVSPTSSPIIPSTENTAADSPLAQSQKSLDPSTASAKKGNLQAFIVTIFSFSLVLLAF